jgi:TP901 family phage tail tape measure protein
MIELFSLIPSWIIVVLFAVTTIVGRAGASKIFFDVVGTFQSRRLIQDSSAAFTTFQSLAMDAFSGIEEAAMMFNEQMQEMVDNTVPLSREIAAARIEFDKFISEANRADLGGEIKDIGVQFGFSGDQALRAGAKMAQLSTILGEESVPAATEMSLAFGMIGEMEAEQAMQRMINLQQQTGFMLRGTTQAQFDAMDADEKARQIRVATIATLNELNAVEDHSAANMERITFVMNQFAAQAHLTGESLAEMAAMSAVLIEAGEEQGKAGRALRMIYARLGADTNGAASELEKLGVAVKKADGTMRPLSEILVDLDKQTANLNEGERQRIAQTVAGNNHYVRMLKLMEGTERMTTLVGHSASNASPVVDILNERFKDTSVQLTQVETDLNNVKAEIGDRFLPITLDATRAQLGFNEAFKEMLDGHLGPVVKGMLILQQTLSKTVGPSFGMFLNIKQMNLALMTAVQVSRSLRGVQLAGFGTTKSQGKALREQEVTIEKLKANSLERVLKQEKMTSSLKEEETIMRNQLILQQYAGQEGHKKFLNHQSILETSQRMVAEKGKELAISSANLGIYNAQSNFTMKEQIALKKKAIDQRIANTIKKKGLTEEEHSAEILKIKQKGKTDLINFENKLRKHAKMMSVEEEQNANKLITKHNLIISKLAHQVKLKEALIEAGLDQAQAEMLVAQMVKQQAEEAEMYNFDKQMQFANSMMTVQIAAMAATGAITMLGDKLPFVEDDAEAAKVAMVMMGISMALLIPEMLLTTVSATGAAGALGNVGLTSEVAAGGLFSTGQAANFATAALRRFVSATIIGAVLLVVSVALTKFLDTLGFFSAGLEEQTQEMEDMFDMAGEAAKLMTDDLRNMSDEAFQIADSFDVASRAVQEFGSSREEMFFGFKAGNVTGDLVKQIKQQGVENFIANTEIIMTNNFNGMTTQQAADEIVSQIESSATLSIGASVNYG